MKKKLNDVLKSSNFKISLITLITISISGITNNNVSFSQEDISSLKDASLMSILMFTLQIVSKIYISYQENGFNYGFLKSSNFISQLFVIISLLLGIYFDEQSISLIISFLTILVNIIFKVSQPIKKRLKNAR